MSSALIGLLAILSAVPAFLPGQNLPCNTYGGPNDERAYALVEATGGGWLLGGWTTSIGPGTPQFKNLLIVRTDALGIPQFAVVSTGDDDEEIRGGARTLDGGSVFCGWTRSYGPALPQANIIVVKLNAAGFPQWTRVFGSIGDDLAYSIVQTHDRGYALCGYSTSWGAAPMPNIFVLKLDSLGNGQWLKIYWDPLHPREEESYSLIEASAAVPMIPFGFIVGGRWRMPPDTTWDGIVLRLDSLGNPVPRPVNVFYGQFNEGVYSVAQSEPTGYAAAGWTNSWGQGVPFANIFVARFSMAGVRVWRTVLGWPPQDEKLEDDRSLIGTRDSGFALCGWTQSMGPGAPPNPNFLIVKLNFLGQVQWTRIHPSFPGAGAEEAYPMIEHQAGGYAIAGFTNSFGVGSEDFHFLTLDQFGLRPACIDSPPPIEDTLPVRFDTIIAVPEMPMRADMPLTDSMVLTTEVCPLTGIKDEIRQSVLPGGTRLLAGSAPEVYLFVSVKGHHALRLLDALGRQLAVLADGDYEVGRYAFTVPHGMAPGVYYLEATARGRRETIKVIRM
jgi:hypothetical protein